MGKIGLSHLLSEHADLSVFFVFSKQCLVENIQKKFQKKFQKKLYSQSSCK